MDKPVGPLLVNLNITLAGCAPATIVSGPKVKSETARSAAVASAVAFACAAVAFVKKVSPKNNIIRICEFLTILMNLTKEVKIVFIISLLK
jgi:hypothetical protein